MMTAPEVGRRRTVELLVAFRLLFHAMLTDEKWTKKRNNKMLYQFANIIVLKI